MSYVGKIVKNTLMFAAVGALVALAAPYVASFLGVALPGTGAFSFTALGKVITIPGIAYGVAGSAALGGVFGGIASAIEPIFNIFSGGNKSKGHGNVVTHSVSHSQSPDLAPSVSLSQEQELASAAPTIKIDSNGTIHKGPGNAIQIPAELAEKMIDQQQAQRTV